jgi:hypothetical protein
MPILPLSPEAYDVPNAELPASVLYNMYVQPTPGGPLQDARLGRPGLVRQSALVGGGVRGLFRRSGVFGAARFSVVGTNVYRDNAIIGTVTGSGTVRFAASETELVIISGGGAFVYNGSVLNKISDEDLPSVQDVAYLAGRFIYGTVGSGRFYWSAIGDAASIDGLDFATAESSPDDIRSMETVGDDLLFFGGDTVEIWTPSADPDAPYRRSSGRRYEKGSLGYSSAVLDNAAFWLGNDKSVYRGGAVPERVSTYGIEAQILDVEDVLGFPMAFLGHTFYVLRLKDRTFAYDVGSKRWSEFGSYDRDTFRASCATTYDGQTVLGDNLAPLIFSLDDGALTDDGEPLIRVCGSFAPLPFGTARNSNVSLLTAKGVGLIDGPPPVCEMRYTDTTDADWVPWMESPLGALGDRARKTTWWGLGLMGSPGRAFEFRCSDPVRFAVYGMVLNEGRA